MSHSSEKRWEEVSIQVSEAATKMVDGLLEVESKYQDLLELYSYAGGTPQAMADLLFKEKWSIRSSLGIQAAMTVDVVGGSIVAVTITQPGTGYTDATGYQLLVTGGESGLVSYDVVGGSFVNAAVVSGGTAFGDGDGQVVNFMPEPQLIYETQANAEELVMATDLVDAMSSAHELYQCANNVVVAQEDRLTQLRRFT